MGSIFIAGLVGCPANPSVSWCHGSFCSASCFRNVDDRTFSALLPKKRDSGSKPPNQVSVSASSNLKLKHLARYLSLFHIPLPYDTIFSLSSSLPLFFLLNSDSLLKKHLLIICSSSKSDCDSCWISSLTSNSSTITHISAFYHLRSWPATCPLIK